jgi:hypothetical protein
MDLLNARRRAKYIVPRCSLGSSNPLSAETRTYRTRVRVCARAVVAFVPIHDNAHGCHLRHVCVAARVTRLIHQPNVVD